MNVPRRISVEDKIRELGENREAYIGERVAAFEKRLSASYQARIDLLREKGFRSGKTESSLRRMMVKARERYLFYQTRIYGYMGLSPREARRRAGLDYEKYRRGWIRAMGGSDHITGGPLLDFALINPTHEQCFICGRSIHSENAITDAKLLEKYSGQASGVLCCNCFKVAKVIVDGR